MKLFTLIQVETPAFVVTSPPGPDETWLFAEPSDYLPRELDAIPSLRGVSVSPAIISLGENLGVRAVVTATFRDHRHIMAGEPFEQGTFWGKWRGRYGQRLRGRPFRLIRGVVGQSLAEMDTWHYVIESVDGPTADGVYTIKAQDALKLADDDRALAPRPTNGFLVGPLGIGSPIETSATLGPPGIGDLQYDPSGYVNIGGQEVCAFTRSGDDLTLTRSLTIPGFSFETEIVDHAAGARVQQCLPYMGEDVADIIRDLFVTFGGVPSEYIDLSAWQNETAAHLATVYTTLITEPTGVRTLASELVEQAALAVWWDSITEDVRLQVLRAIATGAAQFDESSFLADTLRVKDQPKTRLSDVLVYFGLRNPLQPIDDKDNYRSALLVTDPNAANEYGGRVTKTIMSRWIPFGAGVVAQRLGDILLGRFRDPPRLMTFDTWRFGPQVPVLGGGFRLSWTNNQNSDGTAALAPIQVTRLGFEADRYKVEAEEMLFTHLDVADLQDRVVTIDSNVNNINLRTLHDSIYPELTEDDLNASPPVTVTFVVNGAVIVGSNSTSLPACDVGDWLMGFVPTLRIVGRIQGHGGDGASGSDLEQQITHPGGVALFTRHAIDLDAGEGQIFGGGGGGAVNFAFPFLFGGGGGAGKEPGAGGQGSEEFHGEPGTTEAGGAGSEGIGGDGGDPGEAGESGATPGGPAGAAIDGDSFVTYSSPAGDIRGPQIN